MRTISGNYPEVWVGYRVLGVPGTSWFVVQDVHSIELAVKMFKKDPPRLQPGERAKATKVHYWKSPTDVNEVPLSEVPGLRKGFEWSAKS